MIHAVTVKLRPRARRPEPQPFEARCTCGIVRRFERHGTAFAFAEQHGHYVPLFAPPPAPAGESRSPSAPSTRPGDRDNLAGSPAPCRRSASSATTGARGGSLTSCACGRPIAGAEPECSECAAKGDR